MGTVSHDYGCLELQSAFAGGVGQGLDAAVVAVAVRSNATLRDALGDGLGGDRLADGLGGGLVAAVLEGGLFRSELAGDQGLAGGVVDDLGVDVLDAAEDRQARTFGAAADGTRDAGLALRPADEFEFVDCVSCLIVL